MVVLWLLSMFLVLMVVLQRELVVSALMLMSFYLALYLCVVPDKVWMLHGVMVWDFLSLSMSLLGVFVVAMGVLSTKVSVRNKLFLLVNMFLCMVVVMAFSVSSFFLFFFFFESSLIPLILMIVGWGLQPERLQAGVYMLIYTVVGSLFFLLGVCFMYFNSMSDCMISLSSSCVKNMWSFWWVFLFGFLVKMPSYPFHLWLLKAHVEAPVAGSMVLAGVILKFGGYGMIRLFSVINVCYYDSLFCLIVVVSLLGGFYSSVVCVRQTDLKRLVAYSSVSHMSMVILGCFSNSFLGLEGVIWLMLGHGLCSSGLFMLVSVVYSSSESRVLLLNKGGLVKAPCLAMVSFLLCVSNMAAPPSLNLLAEICLYICISSMYHYMVLFFAMVSFFSAAYSLYLYTSCFHGSLSGGLFSVLGVSHSDTIVLMCHWIPLNMLVIVGMLY
nr:NADH dehydrogenase subunit 4 [Arcuatula senhousia]WPW47645.1 NADH dehydrogenase subunit 4 [Arcuatula senhousia]